MIEVEFKIRIDDREGLKKKLSGYGFEMIRRVRESDSYFDTDDRRIYLAGEALRVREVLDLDSAEENSCITFKGKKLDTVSKTRKEIETGVESAASAVEIFESLGYSIVKPRVVKERHYYQKGDIHACLDAVEGLGNFLEVETVIKDESCLKEARSRIADVVNRLGYDIADAVSVSYLGLLKNKGF